MNIFVPSKITPLPKFAKVLSSPLLKVNKDLTIYFLGINGWYDTEMGNTICTLVKHKDYNIILDAGFGIHKIDKTCDFNKPSYLFLSHLHIDHICGLHLLCRFNFRKGLRIFIKKELKSTLNNFLSDSYTVPLRRLLYKTEVISLTGIHFSGLPFKVEFLPLRHSISVLGYRFEIEKKIISYIADTGYCEEAEKLAKNADILICESSYLPGEINKNWPHLNPELAQELAIKSGAKKLILTHFAADKYGKYSSKN